MFTPGLRRGSTFFTTLLRQSQIHHIKPSCSRFCSTSTASVTTVGDVLAATSAKNPSSTEIQCTAPTTPVLEALGLTQTSANSALIVADDTHKVVGIFCETDVVLEYAKEHDLEGATVGDVMKAPIFSASCNASASKALSVLSEKGYQHLPVVADSLSAWKGEDDLEHADMGLDHCMGMLTSRQLCAHFMFKLNTEAAPEGAPKSVRELIKSMRANDTARPLLNTHMEDDCSVAQVIEAMQHKGVRSTIVHSASDPLMGIITSHDIARYVLLEGRDPATVKAKDIMTVNPQTVHLTDTVVDAVSKLIKGNFHHLPVVGPADAGVMGMLSLRDVAALLFPEHKKPPVIETGSMFATLTRSS